MALGRPGAIAGRSCPKADGQGATNAMTILSTTRRTSRYA
jgi:hypothetical protein